MSSPVVPPTPTSTFAERTYHGSGFVSTGQYGTAAVTFTVPFAQTYELVLRHKATRFRGDKYNVLRVDNGGRVYEHVVHGIDAVRWDETTYVRRYLEPGATTITLVTDGQWGFADLDQVVVTAVPRQPAPAVGRVPVDPDASEEAQGLLAFLADEAGRHVLAGQHDIAWTEDPDWDMLAMVKAETGREPAIMGYDFMHMRWGRDYPGGNQDREAIAFAERGGIVMISWHWMPGESWGLYAGETPFRIDREPTSAAYATLLDDIDEVAGWLTNLEAARVPVLFRPLHEAVGGGFWWSANGPDDYKWLYRLLWSRLVGHHGLHNLLWVWNGGVGSVPGEWYPGDDVVDVAGIDYGNTWEEPRLDLYAEATDLVHGGRSLAGWSEVDAFPDPDVLVRDGAWWSFVMHWYDDGRGTPWSSEPNKLEFYSHDFVLTLDELPDLSRYPH